MAEWSNALVLKTSEGSTSGGSNPSPSAIILQIYHVKLFITFATAFWYEHRDSYYFALVFVLSLLMAVMISMKSPDPLPLWVYIAIIFVPSVLYVALTFMVSGILFLALRPDLEPDPEEDL
jgi:predicted branched-subunit amino acid permease